MNKIISLLMAVIMVFSLCACGSKEAPVQEEVAVEVTDAPVEEAPDYEALAAEASETFYSSDYAEAFAALEELQDCGIESVTELLAICHYYGYGTEADPTVAVEMLEGCDSLMATYILAQSARSGNGSVQNPEKANELYASFVSAAQLKESEEGLSAGEYAALCLCYGKGLGTELDAKKAAYCLDKAIAGAELSVFEKLELADYIMDVADSELESVKSELNESGYVLDDLNDESKTFYMTNPDAFKARVAEVESMKAQANELYAAAFDGISVLAEEWNLMAIKYMGDYYFGALGNEAQDYAKAMDYYMQAADFDFAPAQAQIGLMYQDGLGVDVNYEMAMEWNNRAAMQGNAQGQAQIGYLYHMGLGVTQNLNEAGRWYSRAADQGDAWAAAKLAETEITNPQLAFEFHA